MAHQSPLHELTSAVSMSISNVRPSFYAKFQTIPRRWYCKIVRTVPNCGAGMILHPLFHRATTVALSTLDCMVSGWWSICHVRYDRFPLERRLTDPLGCSVQSNVPSSSGAWLFIFRSLYSSGDSLARRGFNLVHKLDMSSYCQVDTLLEIPFCVYKDRLLFLCVYYFIYW